MNMIKFKRPYISDEEEMEEYGSLSSSEAIKEAEENGGEVIFPTPTQLYLDLDSEESVNLFLKNLPMLDRHVTIDQYGYQESRTPGRYHGIVELHHPVMSDMERVLFQTILGSDPKREFLSYMRILKRDLHPTLFIEGGKKPVKEER
jgi:hypothetical protein